MKYYRSPVKGIDENIQHLQDMLHDDLLTYWNLGEDQYQCYPRCHKLPSESGVGYIPAYYGSDGNYKEIGADDTVAVTSFFGLGEQTKVEGAWNIYQVHLIYFANLEKLATYPSTGDVRADLEAREIVQSILGQNMFGATLLDILTGTQRSLEGYNIGRTNINQTSVQQKRGEKLIDMQPFHVFRYNMTIRCEKPRLI